MTICCPCDELIHPPKPEIPAGLSTLPRHLVGFPVYRLAMLRDIPTLPALADWRAREGDDLGLMLIEMWAYVLDILSFYDERIANESYLRTAALGSSLRRLVNLVGYLPRPALASSVVLAAIAEGPRSSSVPVGTAFRSEAFDDEPPQVFESDLDVVISHQQNEWQLQPVRDLVSKANDEFLLESATAGLSRDQLVLFRWSGAFQCAARVTGVESLVALDGATYSKISLEPPPTLDTAVSLSDVEVLVPSLSATPSRLFGGSSSPGKGMVLKNVGELVSAFSKTLSAPFDVSNPAAEGPVPSASRIKLDALYPQIVAGDGIIVQRDKNLHAAEVTGLKVDDAPLPSGDASIPVTEITFDPPLPTSPVNWCADPARLTVHFNLVDGGRPTRVAEIFVEASHFLGGIDFEGPIEPLETDPPDQVFLHDARKVGVLAAGTVALEGRLTLGADAEPFPTALRTPVRVLGNLIQTSRGETVVNEVLGSGDSAQAFQSFTLAKKPVTYFNDPAAVNGRRSTLDIRVNGLLRREVTSFFDAGPEDEIYIARQNDDEETTITFGDGVRGARLPTGVENVVASYRFGAGAAKPPANTITQIARSVKGLRSVLNPVAAGGGADADKPEDIRENAPTVSLTLGRAVSLPDFEALAGEFGGVVNARAAWSWDEACQRAVVKLWFISDGGDIADDLRAFLLGQAEPNTPLVVAEATAMATDLVIDIVADERFVADTVELAVAAALSDPETGILAPKNIDIGCPIFRSRILEEVLSVEGVDAVRALTVDGKPAPEAIITPEGKYRDFTVQT